MTTLVPAVRLAVSVLAICSAAWLTHHLWQWRSFPTAQPLLGAAVTMLAASVVHLVVADLSAPDAVFQVTGLMVDAEFRVLLMSDLAILVGSGWILFVLQYTGRARRLLRAFVATLGTLFLASIATTGAFALGAESAQFLREVNGTAFYLTVTLMTIGVFLMIAVAARENPFPRREPLVLSGGAAGLVLGSIVILGVTEPVVFPAMVVVAAGAFGTGVAGVPTFEMLPAVHIAGRDRIIERMTDAVVVVDREGSVRDLNPAGADLFGIEPDAALGRPLADLLGSAVDLAGAASTGSPFQVTVEDRTLAVTTNRVTDERGRSFGYLLVCEDVTERQLREQRLAVLNSLLIQAVRERMAAVADDAARVETGDADPSRAGDRIWTTATDLAALAASARRVERAIAESGTGVGSARSDVRTEAREVADQWADTDGPAVSVSAPAEPVLTRVPGQLLRAALEVLLEDAERAGSEAVDLRVSATEHGPEIRILTAAAGADGREQAETASTTRLSVVVARQAIDHVGGEVVTTEAGGRRHMRLQLPPLVDIPPWTAGENHPTAGERVEPAVEQGGRR